MVLDISIKAMHNSPENSQKTQKILNYPNHCYTYTVHVDRHRILTLVTSSDKILSDWINGLIKPKATKNKKNKNKNSNNTLVVAVSAECKSKRVHKDQPYDLLTLCVASHCLIYHLPKREYTPKSLRDFFEDPRVVAVGMEMEKVARKLKREHGIAIKNAVDLRSMAVEGLKKEGDHLDLLRYDLDRLAKTVLGKHMDVVRPLKKVEWFCLNDSRLDWWWKREMTLLKVQFVTVDAYLFFRVGSHLHRKINCSGGTRDSFDSKEKKKKKKMTKRK